MTEGPGGPWRGLDAGRKRPPEVARGAREGELGALRESVSRATGPAEEQVRIEASAFPILARRLRALEAEVDELSDLVAAEVAGGETCRRPLTVPGVGRSAAARPVASVQMGAFPRNDKLAGCCGLTPRDAQPGATICPASSSPEGGRCLKGLPVFSCLSPVGSDSEFGRCYGACRARGVRQAAALKAAARKGPKVIFAVMRDVGPWGPGWRRPENRRGGPLGRTRPRWPRMPRDRPGRHAKGLPLYSGKPLTGLWERPPRPRFGLGPISGPSLALARFRAAPRGPGARMKWAVEEMRVRNV